MAAVLRQVRRIGRRRLLRRWSLTYLEPVFQDGSLGRKYEAGICPVAEATQPQLMQLKTNYGDQETIDRQAEALARTIRYFD